jgi:hypothetical protein
MMRELRYTLICDGSSDTVLMPILTWALRVNGITCAIHPEWADLRGFCKILRMEEKIRRSIKYYPCDILFVHRDAEKESPEQRVAEIENAIKKIHQLPVPPSVCVIPIRMQEAWLLFDERAIRHAADNRNGTMPLNLRKLDKIEDIPDPKAALYELLKTASGLTGRHLKKFRPEQKARHITEFMEDFSPLRRLSAFMAFEKNLRQVICGI